MTDTRNLLDRAARTAPPARFELDDLRLRRDRRKRGDRVRSGAVGLSLAVILGLGAATVRGGGDVNTAMSRSPRLPAASEEPLVAADGQYYVHRVHLYGTCANRPPGQGCWDGELRATWWWAPDDSGRIQVEVARAYGIRGGRFDAGQFPNVNGIDVSTFPTDPSALYEFLLARSRPNGASPAPLVSPPPGGAPEDGRVWRAITDLLADPHGTPAVRAALLEVASGLRGSTLEPNGIDPAGRPAHVISQAVDGDVERLYVDPATHEYLASAMSAANEDRPYLVWLVETAGVADGVEDGPTITSIPSVGRSDVGADGGVADVAERCSQGAPDLQLALTDGRYDVECFVVEAEADFTITLRVDDVGVRSGLAILDPRTDEPLFIGEPIAGPGSVTYSVPRLTWAEGGGSRYVVRDVARNGRLIGPIYVR